MPCYEPRDSSYSCDSGMQDRIDELTQNLCYLCANLKDAKILKKHASPRILKWWKQHQIDDTKRVKDTIFDIMNDYYHDHREFLSPVSIAEGLVMAAKDEHPLSKFHEAWFYFMAGTHVKKFIEKKKAQIKKKKNDLQRELDAIEEK